MQYDKTDRSEGIPGPQPGERKAEIFYRTVKKGVDFFQAIIIKQEDYVEKARIGFLNANPHVKKMIEQGIIELIISESADGAIMITPVSTI